MYFESRYVIVSDEIFKRQSITQEMLLPEIRSEIFLGDMQRESPVIDLNSAHLGVPNH